MSLAKKKENDERFSLSPKGTCDYQNEGKSLFSISKQNTLKKQNLYPYLTSTKTYHMHLILKNLKTLLENI